MNDLFLSSFSVMFMALAKIFLIAAFAAILVRRKIVTEDHINAMSALIVNIFLPCMILDKNMTQLSPDAILSQWYLPLAGITMSLLPISIGLLFFKTKKHLAALVGLQNMTYLVLPIGQMIYREQFDQFASLCFLFILGGSALVWGLGKYLLLPQKTSLHPRHFITVPLLTNLLSITMVLFGFKLPPTLIGSASLLGSATIPLATFVLGATLGTVSLRYLPSLIDLAVIISIKFLCLPFATFLLLLSLKMKGTLLGDLLLIQATSAPATALILQSRKYGGNTPQLGSTMLITYLVCMIMMPLWLTLWKL